MPKLTFVVDLPYDTDDSKDYLVALREHFIKTVELSSWGFTNDEVFASSHISGVSDART